MKAKLVITAVVMKEYIFKRVCEKVNFIKIICVEC